jgi:hypothetical protein
MSKLVINNNREIDKSLKTLFGSHPREGGAGARPGHKTLDTNPKPLNLPVQSEPVQLKPYYRLVTARKCVRRRQMEGALCEKLALVTGVLLIPKFGKESDLWAQLDEESVWWKEGFLRCIRQKDPRSAICLRSAKEQLS